MSITTETAKRIYAEELAANPNMSPTERYKWEHRIKLYSDNEPQEIEKVMGAK